MFLRMFYKEAPTMIESENIDKQTVAGFGDEWTRFDYAELDEDVLNKIFDEYFSVFPWKKLPKNPIGADIGCGSGRWAKIVAPRVEKLILVDASEEALFVAKKNLRGITNVSFEHAPVDQLPFKDSTLDFAYSLGVLHHVPDTLEAIKSIASKLKDDAPLLVYLYYSFDNRSILYRLLWRSSDIFRMIISRLPHSIRYLVSQIIALTIYLPLAKTASLLEHMNACPKNWPLAYYKDKPLYIMRTDALDRFGTRLEQRFSKKEIHNMLSDAGFVDICFSTHAPFWCAAGTKG